MFKLFGIIGLLAMIGFAIVGCKNPVNPPDDGGDFHIQCDVCGEAPSICADVDIEVEITVEMWDSSNDGWDGNAALRINVNGSNLPQNARLSGSGGPVYYTFTVHAGDVVQFYWVNGNNFDYESAFAVYFGHNPPNPAFHPNPNIWSPANDPSGRVLLYKQYNSSGTVGNGTLMGGFEVPDDDSGLPPLSGTVDIDGIAQVGETLEADVSNLGGSGTISYQWKRGTENTGSDSSTYLVQAEDVGSAITVTVTRSGNSGSVSSQETDLITIYVSFDSASADGSLTQTTTELTLVFSQAIAGLTADDITLSGVSDIQKGTISGSGAVYTLPISGFTSGGDLDVFVEKAGFTISGSPHTVAIYYATNVVFNGANANGSATQTTTELTLTFSQAITGLTADDITLSGVSDIQKGTISGTGPTYTLPISGFTSGGDLHVFVDKSGFNISGSPNTVTIYYATNVTFNSVSANGSATQTTTELTLTFSQAIAGLTANDITLSGVSGVQKGTLSGAGPTYTLPISGFTGGGTLNVAVEKSGFTISGSPKTATIYYATSVVFNGVTANGSATQTSTQLTLNFSQAISGLTANDITLSGVSGVQKGSLSGTGPTYTMPISGFTSGGTLNVAVEKAGFNISGSPKTATIYYATPVTFNTVTANGSATQHTTQLTLTFSRAISGLNADDITLSGISGVRKGFLSGSGTTYTLQIGGFTSGGTLSVAVERYSFEISPSSRTATIFCVFPSIQMVQISAGTFTMGSPSTEPGRWSDEGPQRQVTLSAFRMGKYEVTQEQYFAVMAMNPSYFTTAVAGENSARLPVEQVSWYRAIVFCNRLSLMEGLSPAYSINDEDLSSWEIPDGNENNSVWDTVQIVPDSTGYRLPTEAQWEYACRAGTTTEWFYGNNSNRDYMWFEDNSGGRTHEVGKKWPNPWGLYDMHGNVSEWCWDRYGAYQGGEQIDPPGPISGNFRLHRGGSWSHAADNARSAFRSVQINRSGPNSRASNLGFRVVRP